MAAQQTQHAPGLNSISCQPHSTDPLLLRALLIVMFCGAFAGAASAGPAGHTTLLEKYRQLQPALAQSIFGEPILLTSNVGDEQAQGEVYALLDTPFDALRAALSQPAQWCELAILHVNVKTCVHRQNQLTFYVGRKYYQPPDKAYALQYRFQQLANDQQQLHVQLSAEQGPLGTSDYLIRLHAIAIDPQHSFIHFHYRYRFGLMARLAMQTYLATLGRNKVGFTITGFDKQGQPIYVKGLQGVVERNVMRYLFAIQAVLEARKSAPQYQPTAGLVRWFAHVQQHPRQLLGFTREEYLENKRRELANQRALQEADSTKELP